MGKFGKSKEFLMEALELLKTIENCWWLYLIIFF